ALLNVPERKAQGFKAAGYAGEGVVRESIDSDRAEVAIAKLRNVTGREVLHQVLIEAHREFRQAEWKRLAGDAVAKITGELVEQSAGAARRRFQAPEEG